MTTPRKKTKFEANFSPKKSQRASLLRNLSPSKQIHVLFNQVSPENPFYQDLSSSDDSREDLPQVDPFERCNTLEQLEAAGLASGLPHAKKLRGRRTSQYDGMTNFQGLLMANSRERSTSREPYHEQ